MGTFHIGKGENGSLTCKFGKFKRHFCYRSACMKSEDQNRDGARTVYLTSILQAIVSQVALYTLVFNFAIIENSAKWQNGWKALLSPLCKDVNNNLLVVQQDIWNPDIRRLYMNLLDSIVLVRVPCQVRVIPILFNKHRVKH